MRREEPSLPSKSKLTLCCSLIKIRGYVVTRRHYHNSILGVVSSKQISCDIELNSNHYKLVKSPTLFISLLVSTLEYLLVCF